MENSADHLLKAVINAVYVVASRRTTTRLAEKTLTSVIESLKPKYQFFHHVDITNVMYDAQLDIQFDQQFTTARRDELAHAIESLIRLVYDDITEEAGMYFITEMKNHLNAQIISDMIDCGVDFDQLQIEQHHSFLKRKKKQHQDQTTQENLLGYSWQSVSNWEYKQGDKTVELYDQQGNIIDKIDMEQAIKNYVEILSGITETDTIRMQEIIKNHEKEYFFLKLIYQDKIPIDQAQKMLNISQEETNTIIQRLVNMELLRFASQDTIELTQSGREFISEENTKETQ